MMHTPPPVAPNRKLAYNSLLYAAMLEIRGLESVAHPWPKWRIISPRYWIRQVRFVRYCGALADALHNLALFSSHDFERFDEDSFWSQIDGLRLRFPGMVDNYRGRFEQRLSELESGTSPQHAWLPAPAAPPNQTRLDMTEAQTASFERLRAIDWASTGNGAFDETAYALFFDYAATASAICRRHGLEGDFYRKLSGLFNFVPRLAGDSAALPESVEHWCTHELPEAYRWRSRWYVVTAALGFVLWDSLPLSMREHITGQVNAPNPYDRLIAFFERGGAFTCEHNMLDRVLPEPPDPETISRLSAAAIHQP